MLMDGSVKYNISRKRLTTKIMTNRGDIEGEDTLSLSIREKAKTMMDRKKIDQHFFFENFHYGKATGRYQKHQY